MHSQTSTPKTRRSKRSADLQDRDHHEDSRLSGSSSCPNTPLAPLDPQSIRALKLIMANAGRMRSENISGKQTTLREVQMLQKSFFHNFGEDESCYHPRTLKCYKLLKAVEALVANSPNAHSGEEGERKFKFLGIPFQRRLQTLTVSVFLFFTGPPLTIIFAVLLSCFAYTLPIMLIYILWIVTLGRPKHPLKRHLWVAKLPIWQYYRDYFPIRLIVSKEVRKAITPERNYMFMYHPHGIHSFGAVTNFLFDANNLEKLLPGIIPHLQTLKVNFFIPFWRETAVLLGAGDASATTIRRTLSAGPGHTVVLVVGGAEESLKSAPATNKLILNRRKGFVKLALEQGAPMVPIYGFGENNAYDQVDLAQYPFYLRIAHHIKKKAGFLVPVIRGRGYFFYNFGILPFRRPIVVTLGSPIEVPKIEHPSPEDVEHWHAIYVESLKRLYDENCFVYDLDAEPLTIVE